MLFHNLGILCGKVVLFTEFLAIIALEDLRNLHPTGAGLAIAAACAPCFRAAHVGFLYLGIKCLFGFCQRFLHSGIENAEVVLHLLHGAHAGKNGHHLRHGIQEAERPFHGGTLDREGVIQCLHIRRGSGQKAATERLHNDHACALFTGCVDAVQRCLGIVVQNVHLHLCQLPVVVVQDAQESVRIIMEGETGIMDFSLCHGFF